MRLPAYLLLPIVGAAVLLVAVLGAWLWPEPTVSVPSVTPTGMTAPVAAEAPPPPPPSTPRVQPARPVQPVQPPPSPVAMPVEPAPAPPAPPPPAPPSVPLHSQITDMSREQQSEIKNKFLSLRERAAEVAERGAQELERQREEARARGDVAEVERLEQILRSHRDRMEKLRQQRTELAPEVQAGPPVQ